MADHQSLGTTVLDIQPKELKMIESRENGGEGDAWHAFCIFSELLMYFYFTVLNNNIQRKTMSTTSCKIFFMMLK